MTIASNPGDLVLDFFAGSGATGAVAHKMGRRWIMGELGEHCHTHIIPRLNKVIDGEDPGGITKAVDWKGVILVMAADFRLEDASRESRTLFSHPDAEARYGASVFWVRDGMLSVKLMRDFLETWQTKRDGTERGIVEIKS